jgi:hypothetical protein
MKLEPSARLKFVKVTRSKLHQNQRSILGKTNARTALIITGPQGSNKKPVIDRAYFNQLVAKLGSAVATLAVITNCHLLSRILAAGKTLDVDVRRSRLHSFEPTFGEEWLCNSKVAVADFGSAGQSRFFPGGSVSDDLNCQAVRSMPAQFRDAPTSLLGMRLAESRGGNKVLTFIFVHCVEIENICTIRCVEGTRSEVVCLSCFRRKIRQRKQTGRR